MIISLLFASTRKDVRLDFCRSLQQEAKHNENKHVIHTTGKKKTKTICTDVETKTF